MLSFLTFSNQRHLLPEFTYIKKCLLEIEVLLTKSYTIAGLQRSMFALWHAVWLAYETIPFEADDMAYVYQLPAKL